MSVRSEWVFELDQRLGLLLSNSACHISIFFIPSFYVIYLYKHNYVDGVYLSFCNVEQSEGYWIDLTKIFQKLANILRSNIGLPKSRSFTVSIL